MNFKSDEQTFTIDQLLQQAAEAEAIPFRPECCDYSNRRIMCRVTMITSHTASVRGAL